MAKHKKEPKTYSVALAGNPNVGKSTVFNCLTGMRQHTGNWAGKTVENAKGRYRFENAEYTLIDLPGTYSLFSRSFEEQCAEEQLSFKGCDAAVVVADGNCLERNLNLVFQIRGIIPNTVLAVNLMDEAKKNGIKIDFSALSEELGIPVVPMSAGRNKGLSELKRTVAAVCENPKTDMGELFLPANAEQPVKTLAKALDGLAGVDKKNPYFAMRMLCDSGYADRFFKYKPDDNAQKIKDILKNLYDGSGEELCDSITSGIAAKAEKTATACVHKSESGYKRRLEALDRVFTGRFSGPVTMLLFLLLILWITVYGANYPSQWFSGVLLGAEDKLAGLLTAAGASAWVTDMLVHGGYKVLAWVVSVMLPPMAIFFPLFTILEDFGYLPRVAFNLDYYLKKANTCGKQALTMCMGFGCNAVGVTGCRIIDSPRERIIAVLTNCFVPCNGRFPSLIAVITMFFLAGAGGFSQSLLSAAMLCGVILLGVIFTLGVSKFLSRTLLKGVPSSFTLELPPYRRPQFLKVIVRSVFDRTLFVLGRAASVAAPAGVVIWALANISLSDGTLLSYITRFMEPAGRALGMDGVILTAFILGFPANEIVIPVMITAYMQQTELCGYSSLFELRGLLEANGWDITTALCFTVFCLMHWPCSTTLLTVRKETKSLKWTLLAAVIPTACGAGMCAAINLVSKLFS